jgi:hypothetical protein
MKTLILGHGRKYEKNNIICSSYDIDKWFDTEYICVDNDPECNPDILFNLYEKWSKHKKYTFEKMINDFIILGIKNIIVNIQDKTRNIYNCTDQNALHLYLKEIKD